MDIIPQAVGNILDHVGKDLFDTAIHTAENMVGLPQGSVNSVRNMFRREEQTSEAGGEVNEEGLMSHIPGVGFLKNKVKNICIKGLMENTFGNQFTSDNFDAIMLIVNMVGKNPASQDGFDLLPEPQKQQLWNDYVMQFVTEFEQTKGVSIDKMFADPNFINSLRNITGRSVAFLESREEIIRQLQSMRSYQGLAEYFLEIPLTNMRQHSITLTDRFDEYLPQWIFKYTPKPAISLIGDLEMMTPVNQLNYRIVGFAYYTPKQEYKPAELSANPMEQFQGLPHGLNKDGTPYQYNFFGPNNPMTEEYIKNNPPINILDKLAYDHDVAYTKYGYNTPEARIADQVLVEGINSALKRGDITKDSRDDMYNLAHSARKYFGLIENH